jgi:hypothetical protein
MTFGQIKSLVEKNLVESYLDQDRFKKSVKEFKKNILNNKSLSGLYTLYDQLSKPQGLSESESKDFLNEGILLIQEILKVTNVPKLLSESKINDYQDIDILVYNTNLNISDRVNARKNIISKLMENEKKQEKIINLPLKTTINIAKQTLSTYFEHLDEETKKEFLSLISEDTDVLESKFEKTKLESINKLNNLLSSEQDNVLKQKISETIDKIKLEKFDHLNYLKLKNLEHSL